MGGVSSELFSGIRPSIIEVLIKIFRDITQFMPKPM